MIKSMTGFGKAVCELPNKKVSIEVKSLNSKQLDLNTRLPNLYREKDLEIRTEIAKKLVRGKVDLGIFFEAQGADKNATINKKVIAGYFDQLQPLTKELGVSESTDYMRVIMQLPDTVKIEQAQLDEGEWLQIKAAFAKALGELDAFRKQEGEMLHKDISARIVAIGNLLKEVEPFEGERIEKIRGRIKDNLQEVVDKASVDENRLEQELIYYIEKLDVTEEKVRLQNHLDFFLETMNVEGAIGKKLGFIAQEIGREVNTLGSKANHAEIQKVVIQMKDELEKIKEQVLNTL